MDICELKKAVTRRNHLIFFWESIKIFDIVDKMVLKRRRRILEWEVNVKWTL